VESLQYIPSWKVIRYEDVGILFEIFDEKTQNRILEALWGNILYSDIQKVEAVFDLQRKILHKRPLDIPEHLHKNIKNFQVYVTALRRENTKDAFCVSTARSPNGMPEVSIYYTGRKQIPPKTTRTFSLSLAVTITGNPSSFISEKPNEFLFVRSTSIPIYRIRDKFVARSPYRGSTKSAVLATCYTNDDWGLYSLMNQIDSSSPPLLVGTHIHEDDYAGFCVFGKHICLL
jgi:hypothetical protein